MNFVSSTVSFVAGAAIFSGLLEIEETVFPPPITGHGVATENVQAGAVTLVRWDLDKKTDCTGQNSRVWNGEGNFHLTEPAQVSSLPMGRITPDIETQIPQLAPLGRLELRIKGFYQCERGGKMPFELGPVSFEVVE